ncbi:amidase, Asp-tRNAAsn/Glu-tRNAGln amidotransferase A subunit [Terriglobus roseus DSM 18391]|uniref:Amidase, Asp-tRNAAsn/Glu-tRNAGln amidotransferase A subunit n=1 Tax=Terriglobus roseus (strain DSM 18391 / NRRL B-41598 / KBS 63) TaxID=926566 RepID=I3ZI98_TERRK|nr:amidase [Terriglobus roseus]AFL88966.1 amidase, Asp-tRNAAsn/Glu-tRNAGln amidotransferase A subunit [Terriglobus roseus DSM 18391]
MTPIGQLLDQLQARTTTSVEITERHLNAAEDTSGEGARVFTHIDADQALREAARTDHLRESGTDQPLLGLPVSVKDLFDVAGEVTTAGSVVLANAAPAAKDSSVVARLRAAGAVLIGRTNMTEFAYSGLGLNPHYGTPANPWDRANRRIPGGSSSGAAVSVTDLMAAAAIGTDTGGSVRIPAALCGLVGFKPTARRVPMDGIVPLARSLDSVGPIAPTVECCARLDAVLSGDFYRPLETKPLTRMRFGILQGYVLEGLDEPTAFAFQEALLAIQSAGAHTDPVHFDALNRIPASNQTAAAEAFAWHRNLLESSGHRYDPHVSARILHGAGMLAADFLDLMQARREIIAEAENLFAPYDAILLPTTPWIAPPIAELEASDDAYFHANGAMLRNTSIFNFLDGCALSIPIHRPGTAPVGLMLANSAGLDRQVLEAGAAIEAIMNQR